MARGSLLGASLGALGALGAVARAAARASRRAEIAQKRRERAQQKALTVQLRDLKKAGREIYRQFKTKEREARLKEKENREKYLQQRQDEVDAMNKDLDAQIKDLKNILECTLSINEITPFESLRIRDNFHPFNPPNELKISNPKPEKEEFLSSIKAPSFLGRMLPGYKNRHLEQINEAESKYQQVLSKYEMTEEERKRKLQKLEKEYENEKQAFLLKAQQRNHEVDELEKAYRDGESTAIMTYNTMVLERSEYPNEFPKDFRLAYLPESKELILEYEFPTPDIIPSVLEYRYISSRDDIEGRPRKATEIKDIYQDIVAAVCLRNIHEIFKADQNDNVQMVIFNGFVQKIDPARGRSIRPFLISVRAIRSTFCELNLKYINKIACLRNLGAQVSPRPNEMLPIKPIFELDMERGTPKNPSKKREEPLKRISKRTKAKKLLGKRK